MQFNEHYADQFYDPMLPEFAHFPQTIRAWEEKSALIRDSLPGHLDISYGDRPLNTFDIFVPPGGPAPLVIHIHGGLWMMCDKRETYVHAPSFLAKGIAFAGLNYTLAPDASLEEIVAEVRTAILWIYRNATALGVNPDAIFLSGHSAGGHLACMAALTDWTGFFGLQANPVKGVISISGLHDLEPLLHARFLQPLIGLTSDTVDGLSPARHAAPETVRLVTAVGGLENGEYRRQTELIIESWSSILRSGLILPDRHHGTIVDALSEADGPLFQAILDLITASQNLE